MTTSFRKTNGWATCPHCGYTSPEVTCTDYKSMSNEVLRAVGNKSMLMHVITCKDRTPFEREFFLSNKRWPKQRKK